MRRPRRLTRKEKVRFTENGIDPRGIYAQGDLQHTTSFINTKTGARYRLTADGGLEREAAR